MIEVTEVSEMREKLFPLLPSPSPAALPYLPTVSMTVTNMVSSIEPSADSLLEYATSNRAVVWTVTAPTTSLKLT